MIGIHDPSITQAEISEVEQALRSNWISGGGDKVKAFEGELVRFFGSREAVSTVNGSAALVLALRSLGVGPGHHVLVSSYGFVATASAVRICGAEPIFLGPSSAERPYVSHAQVVHFLRDHVDSQNRYRATGKPLVGMLYNEPYGLACPRLNWITHMLDSRGMFLVEDASQSLGVKVSGRWLGTIGHFGAVSCNGNKTLTTGAGGFLLTHDSTLAEKARKLQHHGRSDSFEFFYDEPGYNFLLSNVLGAIGLGQVRRLPELLEAKLKLHAVYRSLFEGTGVRLLAPEEGEFPAWLNVAVFPRMVRGREPLRLLADKMKSEGYQLRPTFPPVTDYPMFQDCERHEPDPEKLRALHRQGICLPSGLNVDESHARIVADRLLTHARARELL